MLHACLHVHLLRWAELFLVLRCWCLLLGLTLQMRCLVLVYSGLLCLQQQPFLFPTVFSTPVVLLLATTRLLFILLSSFCQVNISLVVTHGVFLDHYHLLFDFHTVGVAVGGLLLAVPCLLGGVVGSFLSGVGLLELWCRLGVSSVAFFCAASEMVYKRVSLRVKGFIANVFQLLLSLWLVGVAEDVSVNVCSL